MDKLEWRRFKSVDSTFSKTASRTIFHNIFATQRVCETCETRQIDTTYGVMISNPLVDYCRMQLFVNLSAVGANHQRMWNKFPRAVFLLPAGFVNMPALICSRKVTDHHH